MKKILLFAVLFMMSLFIFSSCASEAPTAEETAEEAAAAEQAKVATEEVKAVIASDSIVKAMEETQQDIEMKTKALEDALEAMENMGQ